MSVFDMRAVFRIVRTANNKSLGNFADWRALNRVVSHRYWYLYNQEITEEEKQVVRIKRGLDEAIKLAENLISVSNLLGLEKIPVAGEILTAAIEAFQSAKAVYDTL